MPLRRPVTLPTWRAFPGAGDISAAHGEVDIVSAADHNTIFVAGQRGTSKLALFTARWEGSRWRLANAGLPPLANPYWDPAKMPPKQQWDYEFASIAATSPTEAFLRETTALISPNTEHKHTEAVYRWSGASWHRSTAAPTILGGRVVHPRPACHFNGHGYVTDNGDVWTTTPAPSSEIYSPSMILHRCDSRGFQAVAMPQRTYIFDMTQAQSGGLWSYGLTSCRLVTPPPDGNPRNTQPGCSGALVADLWDGRHWRSYDLPLSNDKTLPGTINGSATGLAWIFRDRNVRDQSGGETMDGNPDGVFFNGERWQIASGPHSPYSICNRVRAIANIPGTDTWIAVGNGPGHHYDGPCLALTGPIK